MTNLRPILGLSALAVSLGAFMSCDRYEPVPVEPFHSAFEWGPAHGPSLEQLAYDASQDTDVYIEGNDFCDKCHSGAAQQQVAAGTVNLYGETVTWDSPGINWATRPSQLCQDCHPLTFNLAPDFVCAPGADVEYCKFIELSDAVGEPHYNINNGCDGAACHSIYPPNTWDIGGEEGNPHEQPPLSNTFPLEGGHGPQGADPGCTDCHPNGSDAASAQAQSGYAASCSQSTCHGRVDGQATKPSAGAGHYPGRRPGWTGTTYQEDRERDCMACHVTYDEATGYIEIPLSFDVGNNSHAFNVPHRIVDDHQGAATLVASNQQVKSCDACHRAAIPPLPTNPQSDFDTAFTGGFYGTSGAQYAERHCDNCHNDGQPNVAPATAVAGVEVDMASHFNGDVCETCHIYGDGGVDGQ